MGKNRGVGFVVPLAIPMERWREGTVRRNGEPEEGTGPRTASVMPIGWRRRGSKSGGHRELPDTTRTWDCQFGLPPQQDPPNAPLA